MTDITLPASYSTVALLSSGLLDAAGAFSVAVNVRVAAGHRLFEEAVGLREAKVFHTCLPPVAPCSLSSSSPNNGPLHRWTFSPPQAQHKQSSMWKKDPYFPRVRKRASPDVYKP